ncbi:MAG TPA: hypothetical protein DCF63_10655 [Planctomycetaceae bacterium]|nr:hypothetical protein [Planctomycetaceae bacterium]
MVCGASCGGQPKSPLLGRSVIAGKFLACRTSGVSLQKGQRLVQSDLALGMRRTDEKVEHRNAAVWRQHALAHRESG